MTLKDEGMEQRDTVEEAFKDAQTLLATLRRQKWPEQYEAINNLALSPNPLADTVLFHLLDLRASEVREAALEALSVRSEVLGRIAARAMLDDTDSLVRNAAAEILGQIGSRQDMRRLSHALKVMDKDWVTRATAADSLGRVGGKTAQPALLHAMTHDPDSVVRWDAAFALCYAKRDEVVPDLEQALSAEKQEQTQVGLLGALYALGPGEYLSTLLKLLHSEDSSVRHAVINSLKEIVRPADNEQAIQAIRDMLQHEANPGLRIDGAKAVDEIAGVAADGM
jgi:HEAT repeat protein